MANPSSSNVKNEQALAKLVEIPKAQNMIASSISTHDLITTKTQTTTKKLAVSSFTELGVSLIQNLPETGRV